MRIAMLALAVFLSVPAALAQECEEIVLVEPGDGSIGVSHVQALYNCCAWIEFDILQDGFEIDVHEWERFEFGPCYCMCCFDLFATVSGLASGEYEVTVWKHRFDVPTEALGPWIVAVSGSSLPGIETRYFPCAQTDVDEPGTWGVIKALYR